MLEEKKIEIEKEIEQLTIEIDSLNNKSGELNSQLNETLKNKDSKEKQLNDLKAKLELIESLIDNA